MISLDFVGSLEAPVVVLGLGWQRSAETPVVMRVPVLHTSPLRQKSEAEDRLGDLSVPLDDSQALLTAQNFPSEQNIDWKSKK